MAEELKKSTKDLGITAYKVSIETSAKVSPKNFQGKIIHCIDIENVHHIPADAFHEKNSVVFVFGNSASCNMYSGAATALASSNDTEMYLFDTKVSSKNYADIYCGTLLGGLLAQKVQPAKIVLHSKDNGFESIRLVIEAQYGILVEIRKGEEPEPTKKAEKKKANKTNSILNTEEQVCLRVSQISTSYKTVANDKDLGIPTLMELVRELGSMNCTPGLSKKTKASIQKANCYIINEIHTRSLVAVASIKSDVNKYLQKKTKTKANSIRAERNQLEKAYSKMKSSWKSAKKLKEAIEYVDRFVQA